MPLPLSIVLIIIGIILAILVSWILGVIVIIIGLVMLIAPAMSGRGSKV